MFAITTDFVGTETTAVTKTRLTSILAYYGISTGAYTLWGDARTSMNTLLVSTALGTIGSSELGGSFLPKINLLNNPARFIPQALFGASEQGAWYDPSDLSSMFQDSAGTIPVTATGQPVGKILDRSGRGNHATQATSAQRPIYGVNPASGRRNTANGSASVADTNYWPSSTDQIGLTMTKVASGLDVDGLPYVDVRYVGTASGTAFQSTYTVAQSYTPGLVGNTFTASVLVSRIAGSASGVSGVAINVNGLNTSNTVLETGSGTTYAGSSETTITTSLTLANALSVKVNAQLDLQVTNGAAIDVTYRWKGLQLEPGSTRTTYQFNYDQYNITQTGDSVAAYLVFDGVDDGMFSPTITPTTGTAQVVMGVTKISDAVSSMVAEYNGSVFGNDGALAVRAPGSSGLADYVLSARFTTSNNAQATGYPAPVTSVFTGIVDFNNPTLTLRINRVQKSSPVVSFGAGNFASATLAIGRRTSAVFTNTRIYGVLLRFGPNMTAQQLAAAEAYMTTTTGV